MLRPIFTNESKGATDLHTHVLKMVQCSGADGPDLVCTKYIPIQIRLIWSDFLPGVVGARGPFLNLAIWKTWIRLLVQRAEFPPSGIPVVGAKRRSNSILFDAGVAKFLTIRISLIISHHFKIPSRTTRIFKRKDKWY